jgi:hypothetical protein
MGTSDSAPDGPFTQPFQKILRRSETRELLRVLAACA